MFMMLLLLAAGIVLLLLGGQLLVDGAVVIARRLGVSTLVIGLTIVAFGTSAPELALNVVAATNGETGLAFGNVVGSNAANIGLVIGLSALIAPLLVSSRIIRLELPWLMVVTVLFVLQTWLPPGVDGAPGYNRLDGIVLVLAVVTIAFHWYRIGRREQGDALATDAVPPEDDGGLISRSPWLCWIALVLGLGMLVAGGKAAEIGAIGIAQMLQVDEVLIGLTIVAIATTLPEIATCVIAARKGQPDLAVGTVVGSNLFNIVLVMGITSIVHPVAVPASGGWWALGAMLVFTLLLWPMALTRRSIGRPEGCLLLVLYAVTIGGAVWTATDRPTNEPPAVEGRTESGSDGQIVVVDHP
tara:strand:- start:4024 stop:5094 length:1071 start_codon:yes stop_codon:yes gene_type:complete